MFHVKHAVFAGLAALGLFLAWPTSAAFEPAGVLTDWIDAKDYLPVGQPDGTTNNSAGIQAGLNAMCSATRPGGDFHMPPGHYRAHDITETCGGVHIKGATAGTLGSGTTWDYSGATAYGLQFAPVGWPAVTSAQLLFSVSVEEIAFYDSAADTTRALDFVGVDSSYASHIDFIGDIYNAIRVYGSYKVTLSNITSQVKNGIGTGITNFGIEITGDLSGQNSSAGACTLGNCSTRTDVVRIFNYDVATASTAEGIYIHGIADTTAGANITIENPGTGLDIECDAGYANITYCPQFTQFTDFETENFASEGLRLYDSSDFQCFGCYVIGAGVGALHAVDAGFTNYSQSRGTGGGVRLYGGRYGNVLGSAISFSVTDTKVIGAVVINANLGNIGAAGIEYVLGNEHYAMDNTFCDFLGTASPAMTAILLDLNANPVSGGIFTGNQFYHCTAGITDNSGSSSSLFVKANNLGP